MKIKSLFMKNNIVIVLILMTFIFGGCSHKNKVLLDTKFRVIDSYNLLDLYPAFLKTDSIISDSADCEYLLWKVFYPNIGITDTKESYVDTTSILGFVNVQDTAKVLLYFKQAAKANIFPKDLKFSYNEGGLKDDKRRNLIGIKTDKKITELNQSNIDKLIALQGGVMSLLNPNESKDIKNKESYCTNPSII